MSGIICFMILIFALIGSIAAVLAITGLSTPWIEEMQDINEKWAKRYFLKRKGIVPNAIVDWEMYRQLRWDSTEISAPPGEYAKFRELLNKFEKLVKEI